MQIFKYRLLAILAFLPLLLAACGEKESYNDIADTNRTQPGPVTNVRTANFAGGSVITYTLPKASNLLYVMAEYKINDKVVRRAKSSYYSDTITVDGFEKEGDYDVTLWAVTRAEVKSDPVTIKVSPEKPPYLEAFATVQIQRDFGGANITVTNHTKQMIGVIVIAEDSTSGRMEPIEQNRTDAEFVNFSVRGFDTAEHKFGVYITDRWGNISDTQFVTLKPIYETLVPKNRFSEYRLPTDAPLGATSLGWNTARLWDGITTDPGWHTQSGAGRLLQICTFDMGVSVKLSRYKLWERGEAYGNDYSYGHGNPKTWTLWGSNVAAPQDAPLPLTSNPGDVAGDWVNLGNFDCPPPISGNAPGQTTSADLEQVKAGFEFNIPLTAPKVRFIRLAVKTSWGNTDFAHVMELSFWGDTK
ncbi:DUF5000 domain-containing lipoprotein [Chitinophaga horti]|uniref:DUF5000 domain-containing lipoprotein n=1 Tax=Chitinophaga horti TaxID=2920382 RepID=A0ABY6IYL7_9BACT|nr:DUF5000 domain-containing lipoprotein [Chitinophaga horti]UYQ91184.1 DUF5000 domain-containing lipoprotein [Chitinophaga horti]